MARSNITFIKGVGASGRQAAGEDYISGLLLYSASLPSGFDSSNRIKLFYSLYDAESAGIKADYSDETKATATYLVTAIGTDGDTVNLKVSEYSGVTVDLGTYTKVAGDSTVTLVGDSIAALINSGTTTHGYSAINTAGSVAIKARSGMGIYLNTGAPLTVTLGGNATPTIAGTTTQFTGGVASNLAIWHYHISEFFRGNPAGWLYVGIYSIPATYTFSEITLIQNFASKKIRQFGIFKDAVYSNADLIAIDSEIKANDDAKHAPTSALYAGNLFAMSDITSIPDLSTLTANKVSSIIGQDGGNLGLELFLTSGKSITQLGIALGYLSLSSVSEDFGQVVDKFNLSDGSENDIPAFANGQLLSGFSDNALDSIDTKRHIFGQKYVGSAGTYFNDNHTAIVISSDYAYINDNRVIDKACRELYTALLPTLKGKLLKNSDGTLADSTISHLEELALNPLYQMQRDGDLSEVSTDDVYIDPSQDVTATSSLTINVKLNENGIARNILVPISFK